MLNYDSHSHAFDQSKGAEGEASDGADSAAGAEHSHTGHVVPSDADKTHPHGHRILHASAGLLSFSLDEEVVVGLGTVVVVVLEDEFVDLVTAHGVDEHALTFVYHSLNFRLFNKYYYY